MQEVKGKVVAQTSYDLDKSPFIALRFNRIDGMNYGRSHVESYLGDLRSLESTIKSLFKEFLSK